MTAAVVPPSVRADEGSTGNTDIVDAARRYEAALVEHDWDALEGLVADDFTLHYTEYGAMQHRRGFVAWARLIGAAYPDFIVSPVRVLVDRRPGDHVVPRAVRGHDRRRRTWGQRCVGCREVAYHTRVDCRMWSNYDEFGVLRQRAKLGSNDRQGASKLGQVTRPVGIACGAKIC